MKFEETGTEEIACLVQTALEDPLIKQRILELLQMDSTERRSVLNVWLEQLRQLNAPKKSLHALSRMFEDAIAQRILSLINKPK